MAPKLLSLVAAIGLATPALGHMALWHPAVFEGKNGPHGDNWDAQDLANPLFQRKKDGPGGWWFHGKVDEPPVDGEFVELVAGGHLNAELSCNRHFTTWGNTLGNYGDEKRACGAHGMRHCEDGDNASELKDVKGCAIAIGYESDPRKLDPSKMVVISVDYQCPWFKAARFEIPAGLPPCPPEGCLCTWNWIHSAFGGQAEMMQTGTSQTRSCTGDPRLPRVVYKPRQTSDDLRGLPRRLIGQFSWVQRAEKSSPRMPRRWPHYNPNFEAKPSCGALPRHRGPRHAHPDDQKRRRWPIAPLAPTYQDFIDPPYYNWEYGFKNGAQDDIFTVEADTYTNTEWAPIAWNTKDHPVPQVTPATKANVPPVQPTLKITPAPFDFGPGTSAPPNGPATRAWTGAPAQPTAEAAATQTASPSAQTASGAPASSAEATGSTPTAAPTASQSTTEGSTGGEFWIGGDDQDGNEQNAAVAGSSASSAGAESGSASSASAASSAAQSGSVSSVASSAGVQSGFTSSAPASSAAQSGSATSSSASASSAIESSALGEATTSGAPAPTSAPQTPTEKHKTHGKKPKKCKPKSKRSKLEHARRSRRRFH
ncbi:hypothetical protein A1Q1_08295 [Trichosporon asahii var. asahii CBS 2479]|uniref:Uncharacterized protein n=1 Tax=Trichosporon asahii var. asahii (strain ATCC 90039 / CBS 2479 / JCM 2466 / KCTC 7840 / NBRC 103889/ NCYC 2677 / UAMH 7654) TaxID=1186058 RepID=J5R446_TRIAS|nr:hypothetical protein A1Q1_08295 [Trichosporon asahii var. asahii CBS 2479]EJT50593.1 hypothetical protein A1Q1_08295 [Trichosporon asahii var. asahii CBS 2479]